MIWALVLFITSLIVIQTAGHQKLQHSCTDAVMVTADYHNKKIIHSKLHLGSKSNTLHFLPIGANVKRSHIVTFCSMEQMI